MSARMSLLFALAFLLSSAAPAAAAVANLPRFTTFGWLSPPPAFTDSLHVDDYIAAGMNVMLPAWRDSGLAAETKERLRLAHGRGAVCIAWDRRLRSVNPVNPATFALLDSIVALYKDDPAFLAYYLGDEPDTSRLPLIAGFFARLAERDPGHPGWNNLSGRSSFASQAAYLANLRHYVEAVHPGILCADHYDLLANRDLGLQVANAKALGEVAREAGLPFWGIVLGVGHKPFREPVEGEMRWQIAALLAYGARGIGWFSYWTPDFDPQYEWQPALVDTAGVPTARHALARRVLGDTRAVGNELAGMTWLRAQFAGSTPAEGDPWAADARVVAVHGRLCLATFTDSLGRDVRFVANSDSLGAQAVRLDFARGLGSRIAIFDPATAQWAEGPPCDSAGVWTQPLVLAPGAFILVRYTPGPGAGLPVLFARPNPARGAIALTAPGAAPGTRVVVRDARGRLVRTLTIVANGAPVPWHGEREDGGRAAPGVYFARLGEGARAASCRFVWSP